MSREKELEDIAKILRLQIASANARIGLLDNLLTECQNELDTANLTIDQLRIANEWYPYDDPRDE